MVAHGLFRPHAGRDAGTGDAPRPEHTDPRAQDRAAGHGGGAECRRAAVGRLRRDGRGRADRPVRRGGGCQVSGALPAHGLKVALLRPQIAPNTGNIARLCVATGTELHLARPMGFVLSDRELRRSAMDYWPRLKLTVHDDDAAFFAAAGAPAPASGKMWLFTSKGKRP